MIQKYPRFVFISVSFLEPNLIKFFRCSFFFSNRLRCGAETILAMLLCFVSSAWWGFSREKKALFVFYFLFYFFLSLLEFYNIRTLIFSLLYLFLSYQFYLFIQSLNNFIFCLTIVLNGLGSDWVKRQGEIEDFELDFHELFLFTAGWSIIAF